MNKYRFHIILLLIGLIAAAGCETRSETRTHKKLLLISFDGFRYDYLQMTETPNFDSLRAAGVTAEGLIPVFPTKTFPSHYSMVTGLYPENSGLVGNTMYDPAFREWYRISDRSAVENGKWYAGEPIWNTLEKQGIRTGTMFWVGSEAPIQDMRPTHWKPFNSGMPYEARIDTVVKWLSSAAEPSVDFATLYFEHVDGAGHRRGLQSDELIESVEEADRLMGYLKYKLQEAGLWSNLNIIVTSDHGMVDLSTERMIVLDEIIDPDDVERIIWDPVTLIQPREGMGEKVYNALKANEANYRVYKKAELPGRFHFKNHRRVSDIVLIADIGFMVLGKERIPSFGASLPSASHGFDNAEKAMHALFLAVGPDFKDGEQVRAFEAIHLYELMNHLMGTQPAPNDGSLDSVRVLLN